MRFTSVLAAFVLIISPLIASAASVAVPPPVNTIIPGQPMQSGAGATESQLRAEVQALQEELTTLLARKSAGSGMPATCSAIGSALGPGDSGLAVSQLQQFLANDSSIYPEGLVTGYYGALTTSAVQAFQAQNGIVSSGSPSTTGYGAVGPRTIAAIQAQCGNSVSPGIPSGFVGGFIQVSPDSGPAPLQVEVEANVNTTQNCGASVYTLDYGDNSPRESISVPAGSCQNAQQTYTHTYAAAGTYTVTLAIGNHSSSATVVVQ
jgi:peptidoglycan hydrolase-like protein with peptidoglycan-binding domain